MKSEKKPESVEIGCWVKIKDPDIGEETIQLVNPGEEQPIKGKISTASPFAQALIGAKAGESVEYVVQGGDTEQVEVVEFGWYS